MDKLTSINRIMDAIDNTILWMLLVYLIDIYLWKLTHSPLICTPLRAEVETHIHSSPLDLFVGVLPSNIHHASLRDRLSSGRSALHDLSHFFKRITLFDTECRAKA
jgi:hypothetical protein